MIACSHNCSGHLCNTQSNCLTFSSHQHNFLSNLNIILKPQQSRNHQLGPITNCIDSRILHNQPLIASQKHLQWHNCSPQVTLILKIVINPLSIQHIMHSHHIIFLPQNSRPHPPQFLHMPTNPKNQSQMYTHSPHISPCLTRNPKDNQVPIWIILQQLTLINGPNSKVPFNRRNNGRPLKHCPSKCFECSCHFCYISHFTVQSRHTNILFSGTLLRFNKASSPINANNQVTCYFRIQSATVARFLDPENPLNPGHHLVGRRICGFVQV
uniref:Uncharacterized protein n=1 Tax=Rhizophora mucronata TaxID=61149 RepID=A0A2P2KIV7_RHIMU